MSYTKKQYYAALKAASDAGDSDAVQYIREKMIADQKASDAAEYSPTAGQSAGRLALEGAGRGVMNVVRNIGNMTGFVSDQEMADAAQSDAALLDTTAGKVGNFIGETAAVTLPTMGAAGAIGRAAGLGNSMLARGAIEGATQGAITAGPENRTSGAIVGGTVGLALPAAGAAYRGFKGGVAPSASAQTLMNRGITLTPGQMNSRGIVNQLEEPMQGVFGIGNMVQGARNTGYEQFQHAVVQDVAAPGAVIAPKANVAEMLTDAAKSFDTAYDSVKGFQVKPVIMRTAGGDIPLISTFKDAVKSGRIDAKGSERAAAMRALQDEYSTIAKKGALDSADLLKLRSNIRDRMRAKKDKEGWEGFVGILGAAEKKVTEAMESQLPADAMKALKATDTQYGKYKIVENAIDKAKDQTGSFTPAQFSQAVKDATAKSEYAKGGGRMRDMSAAAVDVFQPKQPMTGRQLGTLALPAMMVYNNPVTGIPLAAGAAMMYGTKAGRKFAAGQTKPQIATKAAEEAVKKKVGKTTRETVSRYGRNALVNYVQN